MKKKGHTIREANELFKPVEFLLDAKSDWRKAIDICLDSPITEIETGLAELTEIHGKNPILSAYSKKLNEDERKFFVEFLKALGVMFKLEVVELDRNVAISNLNNPYISDRRWNRASVAQDYSIPELGNYLTAKKVSASLIIWNTIINTHKDHAYAKFALTVKNGQPTKLVDSSLVYLLKKYPWIPNKSGEFCKPQDITRETLHPDFPFNDSNNLLTAIEFGKEEKNQNEVLRRQTEQASSEYQTKKITAKNKGFDSPEEMDDWEKLTKELKAQGKSPAEIRESLKQTSLDFSDDASANPERRSAKVKEAANDAPERRTEIRERSVAVDNAGIKSAAKAYLKDRYTKDDSILYCQICKQPMPFKLDDGSYYFEAVELLKTDKRHKENHLALCPTDAAKFLYANESKDSIEASINALIARTEEDINSSQDQDNICHVKLAGNTEMLTFSPIHLLDLKAITMVV